MENIDKILKDKLESYRPEVDEAAWGAFATKLERAKLPFYKKWFGPYILNGLVWLGTVAFLFYFWPTTSETPPTNTAESIVLVDTVYVRDTVYLEKLFPEYKQPEEAPAYQAYDSRAGDILPPAGLTTTTTIADMAAHQNTERKSITENHPNPTATRNVISQKSPDNTIHWQDTISERDMMRYLFGSEINVDSSTRDGHPFEEFGDSFEAKKTTHFDIKAGPLYRLIYPVDGFIDEEVGFLRPGFQLSLMWNKRLSLNMGIQTGKGNTYVEDVDELPLVRLQQFPDWQDFHFQVENIRIYTDQMYFPVDVSYHFPVYRRVGVHVKAGMVTHYIRKQEFYYDPYNFASFPGVRVHTAPKTWQISYLQTGLGINYQLSRRFSTHLDGEYWHGIRPIGGEQNRYRWLGMSLGLNFHLFPE